MEYLNINFNEAVKMIDNDFCLGLCNEKITVEAQNKIREIKKKHQEEEYKKHKLSEEYDMLCAKYMLVNQLLKGLRPLTTMWGNMITRKVWLEYEMNKLMEEF